MPSSTAAGKPKVAKWLNGKITGSEYSILDLGCGKGTYGRLINKPCKKIAVDAVDYRKRFELMKYYDTFYQHDISDISFLESLGKHDMAILGDVLEHLYFDDARNVLDCLEKQCQTILVSVPFKSHQWGVFNHWENHLQEDLTEEVFKERYPEFVPFSFHRTLTPPYNGEVSQAYYIWEKEEK